MSHRMRRFPSAERYTTVYIAILVAYCGLYLRNRGAGCMLQALRTYLRNADRSNDDFAYGGIPNSECTACLENSSLETWEAPDIVKGDIARAMMYMAVRYAGGGSADGNTPNLELVDRLTNTGEAYFGDLCDLVAWHQADPVSSAEQTRNTVIYSWQGNRNPFIDHPEYVLQIFGSACGITPPEPDSADVPLPPWAMLLLGGFLGWRVLKRVNPE